RLRARATKVCVVLRGSLDTCIGGVARRADVLLHPANRPINVVTGKAGASTLSVDIDGAGADRFAEVGLSLNDARSVHCPEALLLAFRMRGELGRRDRWTPLVLEAFTLQLMVLAFRRDDGLARAPEWLRRVEERIAVDDVGPSRLSDYAREAGVHPRHLARAFRQHTGFSVGERVRRERVARAAALLANSQHSLSEIATLVGFCDQPHLTRTFKSVFGM